MSMSQRYLLKHSITYLNVSFHSLFTHPHALKHTCYFLKHNSDTCMHNSLLFFKTFYKINKTFHFQRHSNGFALYWSIMWWNVLLGTIPICLFHCITSMRKKRQTLKHFEKEKHWQARVCGFQEACWPAFQALDSPPACSSTQLVFLGYGLGCNR